MDIGRDILTRTLIGSTAAEKVFTPWWMRVHHYLVYTLVVLGLIALPINSMLSINGNCSYDPSNFENYLYPHRVCRFEDNEIVVEKKFMNAHIRFQIKSMFGIRTEGVVRGEFEYFAPDSETLPKFVEDLTTRNKYSYVNFNGCWVKSDPRFFGFHVYWACVNHLGPLALYFPHLLLILALILVTMERLLTRYMWTGARMAKFYKLLIKKCLETGETEKLDAVETKKICKQIMYDFRNSTVYCEGYVWQTLIKIIFGISVLVFSLFFRFTEFKHGFQTVISCPVADYHHTCSIPSNGMNKIIFNLAIVTLCFIVIVAFGSFLWHFRFYLQTSTKNKKHHIIVRTAKAIFPGRHTTQLGWLVEKYRNFHSHESDNHPMMDRSTSIEKVFCSSPDMQMLLSLLAETEGMWAAILILCAFDPMFKQQFKIQDAIFTSVRSQGTQRCNDITIEWNEPSAIAFIVESVPKEHLMYVLELSSPNADLGDGEDLSYIPDCNEEGACVYHKSSKFSIRSPKTSKISSADEGGVGIHRMNIVDANLDNPPSTITAILPDQRKKSAVKPLDKPFMFGVNAKVRKFKTTFYCLREDTDYVLQVSFVMSGKKLSSEVIHIGATQGGSTPSVMEGVDYPDGGYIQPSLKEVEVP